MPARNKGLVSYDIDNNQVLIDPDNLFWGIVRKGGNQDTLIPRELLSLYAEKQEKCDKEIEEFRFSSELTAVYIDPTDLCNANCPYCYVPAKIRAQGRSMTEEELESILSKISRHFKDKKRKPVIVFHASEPLLVKGMLFKAIDKFKENLLFGIQTNALLLEKEDADFIKSRGVSIGISLDAAIPSINNRLRRSRDSGGNFKKAIQAIEWLKGYEGLNVIATITRLNVRNLPSLVKFLHKKGVGCVLLNPVRLTQANSRGLRPDDKLMAKYFIRAVEEAIRCSMNSEHQLIIGNFTNTILAIVAPAARRLMCDISPCGGGRCFFTITARGEMIPCGEFIGLKGFSGGNIFKDTIPQAMQSAPFKKIRSRIVEKIPECVSCAFRNICGAPCPAEMHALGDMYKKSVFCEFYKEIIRYALRLISEGREKYQLRKDALGNLEYEYKLQGRFSTQSKTVP